MVCGVILTKEGQMKKLLFILLILTMFFITSVAYAQAPDRRICDTDGDCVNITATGLLQIS